jgi:hypothetical protein
MKSKSSSHLPYKIYCDSLEEVQEAIESSEFIRPALIEGCERLIGAKRQELLIAEIFSLDTYATIRISIKADEIGEVLAKTLDWFEEREEYEECSEIKRLMNAWSTSNHTPSSVTPSIN